MLRTPLSGPGSATAISRPATCDLSSMNQEFHTKVSYMPTTVFAVSPNFVSRIFLTTDAKQAAKDREMVSVPAARHIFHEAEIRNDISATPAQDQAPDVKFQVDFTEHPSEHSRHNVHNKYSLHSEKNFPNNTWCVSKMGIVPMGALKQHRRTPRANQPDFYCLISSLPSVYPTVLLDAKVQTQKPQARDQPTRLEPVTFWQQLKQPVQYNIPVHMFVQSLRRLKPHIMRLIPYFPAEWSTSPSSSRPNNFPKLLHHVLQVLSLS